MVLMLDKGGKLQWNEGKKGLSRYRCCPLAVNPGFQWQQQSNQHLWHWQAWQGHHCQEHHVKWVKGPLPVRVFFVCESPSRSVWDHITGFLHKWVWLMCCVCSFMFVFSTEQIMKISPLLDNSRQGETSSKTNQCVMPQWSTNKKVLLGLRSAKCHIMNKGVGVFKVEAGINLDEQIYYLIFCLTRETNIKTERQKNGNFLRVIIT